jgi:NAD(P)-dependent dehydrogenase (short-subunit alcohol dehydrogenase family)
VLALDLAGKVAIVTGAAKPEGIGYAVALGLARRGADVVVADLYERGFAGVTRAIEDLDRRCLCVHTDVLDQPGVQRMVDEAVSQLGRVDILVNAVGGSYAITEEGLDEGPAERFVGLATCTAEEWRTIVGVNLDGTFHACRAVAPLLQAQGSGRIVNFSSMAARRGVSPGSEGSSGPYAVAKAGVIGLTKQLALELAPHGVTVNCVAPGVILSWRGRRTLEHLAEDARGRLQGAIPMGRFGTPDEVAALVVALCSGDMSYVTGATIDVNGGMYSA